MRNMIANKTNGKHIIDRQSDDELKIIIYNKHDLEFAESCAKNVKKDCLLYLQPEWGKKEFVMSLVVKYIMQNPKWKISLQTHKYLDIP